MTLATGMGMEWKRNGKIAMGYFMEFLRFLYNLYYRMCKRYIQTKIRSSIRRLDCLDLHKVYFIHKKKTPPLPKFNEEAESEDMSKCLSPTGT